MNTPCDTPSAEANTTPIENNAKPSTQRKPKSKTPAPPPEEPSEVVAVSAADLEKPAVLTPPVVTQAYGVGIYSFPKSGNTWMRNLLMAALYDSYDNNLMEKVIPDTHQTQIFRNPIAWPEIIEAKPHQGGFNQINFYKSHFDTLNQPKGEHKTHLIIHIRRNPLDVFTSYMNYISDSVTKTAPVRFPSIDAIKHTQLFKDYFSTYCVTGNIMPGFRATTSWFDHNEKWLRLAQENVIPVVTLRYEDMIEDLPRELGRLREYLNFKTDDASIINRTEKQTEINGKFFWKKRIGTFRQYLTEEQMEHFIALNHERIERAGYESHDIRSYFYESQ